MVRRYELTDTRYALIEKTAAHAADSRTATAPRSMAIFRILHTGVQRRLHRSRRGKRDWSGATIVVTPNVTSWRPIPTSTPMDPKYS